MMKNNKQTAVDFLAEQYDIVGTGEYEQAKEMEKQQQGYSEEEVIELTNWYLDIFLDDALGLNGKDAEKKVAHLKGKGLTKDVMKYWFEQFKKI